jgi:spermidine/putrescine transport system substrate-binding protein
VTTFHPREPRRLARREFLRRSALGAAGLVVAPSLFAGCGGGDDGTSTATELPLARPDSPVTLPLYDDNAAIASGLDPEGGPLRIYNWVDYLWPKKLKEFGKEYGVDVEVTTFSTMDEAIAKLASGAANFDVFFPTTDRISRLAYGKLLQPLNRDYVPNLANVWKALQDPFYDKGSRYTVPYVTFSTGIGYRRDRLGLDPAKLDNPYDVFWDESLRGKVWLLDDAREAIALALLRKGETDVNTEDPALIDAAKADLLDLISAVNVKVSTEDYSKVPEGVAPVHQAWSGSMIAAQWYLPEGVGAEELGFWFPADGRGPIGSDQMAVLRAAKNPVLAHHFLDFMLEEKNAYDNFAQFVGYQPPLTSLDPDRLVADEVVPPTLRSAVVRESDFDAGLQELELSPDGQVLWQNAWAEFKAGL